MNKILASIYHDSSKNYVSNPYPVRGEKISIKLRLINHDSILGIYIRYRDQGVERIEKMEVLEEINGLTYFSTDVEVYDHVLSYQFNIVLKDKIYYYSQHKITDYVSDESTNFKILVDYKAPTWMQDQVFYQILPDRFYNARPELTPKEEDYIYQGYRPIQMKWNVIPLEYHESHCLDFYGGDLYGIIEKLDYLKDLGVTALYLNPIFQSPTMHKYDALDYFKIDESLGGEDALIELSKQAHDRGMKVMLDISINHTSSDSKWFNKDGAFYDKSIGAYNNRDAEERSYYFIDDENNYESWFAVKTMPSLNYSSSKLRDIIYKDENSVLKKYIKEPFNIDGWRFDVADVMARNRKLDLYYEVWEEINKELKATKEDTLILAEEWADAPEMYNQYRWDSTMNYFSAARPIREFAGEVDLFTKRHPELSKIKYEFKAEHLAKRLLQVYQKQAGQITYQMLNLIDSHDVPRLHNNKDVSFEIYKGAVICLFGLPGSVNIYYGDEKYLDGHIKTTEGARYPMNWNEFNDLNIKKKEIFSLYGTLARLKSSTEVLKSGGFKIVHAKGDVFAFVRFMDKEAYLFVWTKSVNEESISIDLDMFGLNKNFEFVAGSAKLECVKNNLNIKVASKESFVLKIS